MAGSGLVEVFCFRLGDGAVNGLGWLLSSNLLYDFCCCQSDPAYVACCFAPERLRWLGVPGMNRDGMYAGVGLFSNKSESSGMLMGWCASNE